MTNYQLNMERIRQGTSRNRGVFSYIVVMADRLTIAITLSIIPVGQQKGRPQYQFVKGTWNKCAAFALLCRESPLQTAAAGNRMGQGD